jgi:hypothetical protein
MTLYKPGKFFFFSEIELIQRTGSLANHRGAWGTAPFFQLRGGVSGHALNISVGWHAADHATRHTGTSQVSLLSVGHVFLADRQVRRLSRAQHGLVGLLSGARHVVRRTAWSRHG